MEAPEFKSGINEDGLLEETVGVKNKVGNKEYARRAVGMHAFEGKNGGEDEKKKYIAEKKLAGEKAEFEDRIKEGIKYVFIKHMGQPSLQDALKERLSGISPESMDISVDKDFLGYRVEVKTAEYGNLIFSSSY